MLLSLRMLYQSITFHKSPANRALVRNKSVPGWTAKCVRQSRRFSHLLVKRAMSSSLSAASRNLGRKLGFCFLGFFCFFAGGGGPEFTTAESPPLISNAQEMTDGECSC